MNHEEILQAGADSSLYQQEAPFQFIPEQLKAIEELLTFISSPLLTNWCFCFRGYAGTGKTSCMREVVRRIGASNVRISYTAPTNKAAKVLREVVGQACTIYSLLGLRVDKNGETKQIAHGKPVDLSDTDVIVVDEASMVNEHLFGLLGDIADKFDLKVVFMGDPAQLPPVKESESLALRGDVGVQLTRVMRHDNQILSLVSSIRQVIFSPAPSVNIKSDNDGQEGVWKLGKMDFKKQIFAAAARGEFADGRTTKVISWRNVKVDEYNQIARTAIFGVEAQPGFFLVGDRVVAAGPCERNDELLLHTDDEAIVEGVIECKHPLEPKYHALELKCRTEENQIIRLLVIHPASKQQHDNDCQLLAHEAQANPKLWRRYWDLKDLFHPIKFAYALTAHRSQGSTYRNVYVDYQDVLFNRDRTEAFKCLYVACSRAQKKLYLA
jgi:AAA domain/UvrD-like helicase C-terminal domain